MPYVSQPYTLTHRSRDQLVPGKVLICLWIQFPGCWVLVFLLLDSTPRWLSLVQRLVQASRWKGPVLAHCRVELRLGHVVMPYQGVWLEVAAGSFSVWWWGGGVPALLFGLRSSSTGAYGLLGGIRSWCQMAASRRAHANDCSLVSPLPVSLSSQWATVTPHLPSRRS